MTMRYETYERHLGIEGYNVIGSTDSWHLHDSSRCQPIIMSLTKDSDGIVYHDNLEELIQLADSDLFLPKERRENLNFYKNYPAIIRGECPDWQLGAFQVFYDGIKLDYGNIRTHETGFLWVIGARRLRLTFHAPRTRLGFDPIYNVINEYSGDEHYLTRVEEDLGYMRREIDFELDPSKSSADIFHNHNTIISVTEYVGI